MPTGPRPMRPDEWEAYTLHLQRVPVEDIEAQTLLSRPRIAAAVDLGRIHARATLEAEAATRAPAVPQPVRIRWAVRRQLPGATIPPAPTLAVPADLPTYTDPPPPAARPARPAPSARPARPAPAAKAVTKTTPPPAAVPAAPGPDLEHLARSPKVRAWAAADGWAVPAEGLRLPGGIVHAYLKAHGGTQ